MESHPDNRSGSEASLTAPESLVDPEGVGLGHRQQSGQFVPAGSMSRMDLTNRFDPYEALELMDRANFSALNLQESLPLIHEQVGLLRAYITGMER